LEQTLALHPPSIDAQEKSRFGNPAFRQVYDFISTVCDNSGIAFDELEN
jgi:hypothetical protein